MKEIQSQINAVKARITQIETSELFSEAERQKQLENLNKELQELIKELEVINPDML